MLLRLAYRVAQVCNADARDHSRVAKNDWRAGERVERPAPLAYAVPP
jgi:hypothetical protein